MERGLALGKSNVKDVILAAKHESGANIKEVNMFRGSGGGDWPVLIQGRSGLHDAHASAF